MHQVQTVELKRDCVAIQIPAGHEVTLPAGTNVDITQALGGNYTVHANGGLYRIGTRDADALGLDATAETETDTASAGPVTEEQVWNTLRTCYDPEIPLNIVDLGLVYSMEMHRGAVGCVIDVKMTLTAPGCGMGGVIAKDAEQKLVSLPGVERANVEIVWEPQWHHSMISEHGRKVLGLDEE